MQSLTKRKADAYAARLFSGELTDADVAEIEAWKNRSEAHKSAFDASVRAWSDMEQLADDPGMQELCDEGAAVPVYERRGVVWPLAASVAIAAIAALQFWPAAEDGAAVVRYTTAIGERRSVILEDGSEIVLNTDSDAIVSMADDRREVILSKGEAFFDVVHEQDKPFTVVAGTHTVTVLGTEFNVYRKNRRETTVAVFDGHVGLHRSEDQMSADTIHNRVSTPDQVVLQAGEVASVTSGGDVVAEAPLTSRSLAGAWRNGRLSFIDATLERMVDELNRYSPRPIVIRDGQAMRLRVSAVVDLDQIEQVIDQLEIALPIVVTQQPDRILISSAQAK